MTMAASIEARAPFLDSKLQETVRGYPDSELVNRHSKKNCLREAMVGILPKEILERKKKGFSLPVRQWFKGELGDALMDALAQPNAHITSFLSRPRIEEMLCDLRKNSSRYDAVLWSIFALEKYLAEQSSTLNRGKS
jgi:asparagine synthase (glutamine-hydrolysing)